jgi:hypothetical protein
VTPAEYIQLKAFARIDGALLALVWTLSFTCYLVGMARPVYGMVALMLILLTPFFAASRLRRFRDGAREGVISIKRGWAYAVLMFFYGGILMALAQYVYFAFIDHGYMFLQLSRILESPEGKQMVEQYGMQQTMTESLEMMGQMRPIDYALNVLTVNIVIGIVLGFPIAALMKKGCK